MPEPCQPVDACSELARAFRRGSEEAFAELVALLRDRLYRLAYRLTGDAEDALDVTQDAFYKLYRDIGQWNERSALYSWLYRVTANLAIDRLRRRSRDRTLREAVRTRGAASAPDVAAAVAEQSDQEAELERMRRAVAALPEGQRTIMVLRHYEGLSLHEIAEVRGCALGTVKSTLHQALRSLQRALGGEAEVAGGD